MAAAVACRYVAYRRNPARANAAVVVIFAAVLASSQRTP